MRKKALSPQEFAPAARFERHCGASGCSDAPGQYAAQETQPVYKYYKEIRVGRGESLWSIAEKYCGDEYGDLRDFIREVCDLNGISGGQVYYGQYLTIPYYSDVHR